MSNQAGTRVTSPDCPICLPGIHKLTFRKAALPLLVSIVIKKQNKTKTLMEESKEVRKKRGGGEEGREEGKKRKRRELIGAVLNAHAIASGSSDLR